MVGANHGGGYLYSVCPKIAGAAPTEDCFTAHTLPFVGAEHTIRWLDGSQPERQILAVSVSEGTFPPGLVWRKLPIPTCNCDHGSGCKASAAGEYRIYPGGVVDDNCSFCGDAGVVFPPPFPQGCGPEHWSHMSEYPWAIVDTVRVPSEQGDYVLRWRWDCEANPQIWADCADLTVV